MATVLLPLAFSAVTSLFSRLLFPQQGTKGPRLNDLTIPTSSYGSPIPRGWGRFRVTGNLIWGIPIIEKKKKSGGKGGPSNTTYKYFGSFAVLLCQGPVSQIRKIWMNGELKYNLGANDLKVGEASTKFAAFFRFYQGTDTQLPDDLIQAKEGVTKTPAYRGFSYIVFENLPLDDYGNRLPTVSCELWQKADNGNPIPVSEIVSDLCLSAGLTTDQFNVNQITDLLCNGFIINSIDSVRSHIEKLQAAYLFDVVDADGKINFAKQNQKTPGQISRDDLGAYEYGTETPSLFKETRLPYKELPNEIRVKYLSEDHDYADFEDYARRTATDPSNRNVETLELSLVANQIDAQTIARKALYVAMMRAIQYEIFLPINYLGYDPGRFMTCELRPGTVTSLLLTKKELGANYLLRFEAHSYDPSVYGVLVNVPSPSYKSSGSVSNAGNTTLLVLDIPLVKDSDADNGLYIAASGASGYNWTSATLYVSTNGGTSYDPVKLLSESSTFGACSTVLAAGITTAMDSSNTLSVTLNAGELISVAQTDLSNGSNKALIGNEIIQFQTATLTAPSTYTLSGLLRGRRGTEWAVATHVANERFVLLTDYLERVQGSVSDLGHQKLFKAITSGQTLDDVTPVSITSVGIDMKPYSPINVAGSKDPVGNITITWTRRDRHAGDRTDYANFPLSDAPESYQIEILNSSGSVLRTLNSNQPNIIYLVADQITDFGGLQSTLSCRIYQMSAVVGRGYPATAMLTLNIVYPPPTIASLNPVQGAIASSVVITGTHFTGATALTFNGTTATFTVNSDTQITTTVPSGATTGLVSLTTPGGNASANFTVVPPPPSITSFTPTNGAVGDSVTITGANFTGTTSVKFGGVPATFSISSDSQITATVPSGSGSGLIEVITPFGTGKSSTGFTINSGTILTIENQGTVLTTTANLINFVGSGVSASNTGNAVTVNIATSSGPPTPMITQYWRVRNTVAAGGNNGQWIVRELIFRDANGNDISKNGTASASYFNDSAAQAFDKNLGSYWLGGGTNAVNAWIQYAFTTQANVQSISLANLNNSPYNIPPTSYVVEYSSDSFTWNVIWSFTTGTNDSQYYDSQRPA